MAEFYNNFKNKNTHSEKRLVIIIGIIILFFLSFGVLFGIGVLDFSKIFSGIKKLAGRDSGKTVVVNDTEAESAAVTKNAYEMALNKAKEWQPDAALSFIDSKSFDDRGNPGVWKMTFVSQNASEKGFLVELDDGKITNSEEIKYGGTGAEFPDEFVSQKEAVEKAKETPGYEDAEVSGVEAVYGPGLGIWYWGVKTDKGTISIKAQH